MSTSILRNVNSSPEIQALLPILQDSSPRPDGTLTRYEEKVRLAWPLLKERFSRTPYFRQKGKLDVPYLLRWLGSHWNSFPEPNDSFISRNPQENVRLSIAP